MTNLIKIRATRADGAERGDDLAGINESVARHLDPHARGPYRARTWGSIDGLLQIGTVQGGGRPVTIYGDREAFRAARRLRRQTISDLARALDTADSTLGITHPVAVYIAALREGAGPAVYRTPGRDYESIAQHGCDPRRDPLDPPGSGPDTAAHAYPR